MKVLVTGSTGFLGSWIVRELLRQGHAPRALVRGSSRLDGLAGLDVEQVAGDVLDPGSIMRAMEGLGAVIHTAGQATMNGEPEEFQRVNVDGTRHVLEAAARRGLLVVHTSTIATLGVTQDPLTRDESAQTSRLEPGFGYVDSKQKAEALVRECAKRGQEVMILNPGILLGPGDVYLTSTRIVLDYLRGLLRFYPRGGISFCDVREVAAAHVAALTQGRRGERYILGGENITYGALFSRLERLTGLQPVWPLPWLMPQTLTLYAETASLFGIRSYQGALEGLRYGQWFNFCDSGKARRELGYEARELEHSLRDTIRDELARGLVRASTRQLRSLLRG